MAQNPLLAAADRVREAATAPPTTELGNSTTSGLRPIGILGGPSWQQLAAEAEQTPELRWRPFGHGAVRIYDKMRADPQIQGLLWGLTLPIRRYKWVVDPNGAAEQTATEFAEDIGLPIRDQPRETVGRTKGRFSHDDHLRHALLALVYGHMFFEQVGEIVGDGPAARWRLRKLAPRMPQSLQRILINERGGLLEIWQRGNPQIVKIPVDRLVGYVWEREASNWTGRSLLRAMYGPWLIKQRLVRVDAIKHERNGMGIPLSRQTIPETNPAALAEAQKLAESIRAGEVAGATLPYGFDLDMKGVKGSLPDTLASIRYCDEVMARSVLMMFMMLGQTQSGSRALGSEFIDYISLNQQGIADWYAGTTSEHVGEDWTDWNDGPEQQAPRVGYERDDHPELAVADLIAAIDAGLVVVSEEDEVAFRERYNLPVKSTARPRPAAAPAPAAASARKTRRAARAATTTTAPTVGHRQPTAVEQQAGVDFEQLHADQAAAVAAIVAAWAGVQAGQVDELVAQVAAAATAAELAAVAASVAGADLIASALQAVAQLGVDSAVAEAAHQSFDLPAPDADLLAAAAAARADGVAGVLSRAIGEAAARHAVALSSGLSGEDLGTAVRDHLEGLSDAFVTEQLGGAVHEAHNEGRFTAMDGWGDAADFYSSELLDTNTCGPCRAEDGTKFDTLVEARGDYVAGWFIECEGGMRCRGTVVAVSREDT